MAAAKSYKISTKGEIVGFPTKAWIVEAFKSGTFAGHFKMYDVLDSFVDHLMQDGEEELIKFTRDVSSDYDAKKRFAHSFLLSIFSPDSPDELLKLLPEFEHVKNEAQLGSTVIVNVPAMSEKQVEAFFSFYKIEELEKILNETDEIVTILIDDNGIEGGVEQFIALSNFFEARGVSPLKVSEPDLNDIAKGIVEGEILDTSVQLVKFLKAIPPIYIKTYQGVDYHAPLSFEKYMFGELSQMIEEGEENEGIFELVTEFIEETMDYTPKEKKEVKKLVNKLFKQFPEFKPFKM